MAEIEYHDADQVKLCRELVFTSLIDDKEKITLPAGTICWMADPPSHLLDYFSDDWLEQEQDLYPYQYTYEDGDIEPVE